MFKKLRQIRYISTIKVPLKVLEKELAKFAGNAVIAICPATTGNSWQGVLTATQGLFDDKVFVLPQYFSNSLYSISELKIIAEMIASLNIRKVVFSGYLSYFSIIVDTLNKLKVESYVIYHGSHTSVLEEPSAALHFKDLICMVKQRRIMKLGLVKKDLDNSMTILTGSKCYPILLKCNVDNSVLRPHIYDGFNIGVLCHDLMRKNIYNQLSAALLIKGSRVHVKDLYHAHYLMNEHRFVVHEYLSDRTEFLRILGGMQINLYVTFSECWGQFVSESLMLGVPCLTSNVSSVLDFDPELKRRLIVDEFDNDYAIFKRIEECKEDLDWFKSAGPVYVEKVNGLAQDYLNKFVYDY